MVYICCFLLGKLFKKLGFSPFELVPYERAVRSPLKLLKESWLKDDTDTTVLNYVSNSKFGLNRRTEIAK